MNPEVSVCVQTYQHGPFIGQCLDAILKQKSDFPFEILLGEDDSNDGTRRVCMEYADRHPEKIRLFLHDRKDNIRINGKPTGRRNFLTNITNARGRYIAVCPGDDFWTDRRKLQKQFDFLERHPEFAMCFHAVKVLQDSRLSDCQIPVSSEGVTNITDIARRNYIHTCSCLYRNVLPDEIPEFWYTVPFLDYVMHLFVSSHGKIKYLRDNMAVYRVHDGGRWTALKRSAQLGDLVQVLNALIDYFANNPDVKRELGKQRLEAQLELAGMHEDTEFAKCELQELIIDTDPLFIVELFREMKDENSLLRSGIIRLMNHPVSGNLIRLLARLKRDSSFGGI